jgi:general stress protein 26
MSESEKEKIVRIMKANSRPAYFATCDGDQPFVRPISPIVEDDLTIWVTTFCSSRKVKQIRKNPKICLAFVEQPNGDKAAVVFGDAEIISGLQKKKRVWKLAPFDLSQHFPKGPESKEFCVLNIVVKKIEWRESWEGRTKIYQPS